MTPRVSVLMTVYNGQPFLTEAIESVLGQTFHDFELVIIDDASTDDSLERIRRYRDARIRWWRNERNIGQVPSLNRGLTLAQAPYVARLDQDDACLPDRLRQQARLLDQRPEVAVVGSRMVAIDGQGARLGVLGRRVEDYGTFLASLLLGLCPLCHPSVMFRRQLISEFGGYQDVFAPAEDVDLWARLAVQRYTAYVIRKPLILHRMHPQQQSVTKAAIQQERVYRVQTRLIEAFCPPGDVRGVSLLLRRDRMLWVEYASPARLRRVLQAWRQMCLAMQGTLRMSTRERTMFRRAMDRWFGLGVRVAGRIPAWCSGLCTPAIWCLSPALVPHLRSVLSPFVRVARRVRMRLSLRHMVATSKGG